MNRTVRLKNNRRVEVVPAESAETVITANDAEMDIRARAAVKSAISRAQICKKPVARYDKVRKMAYIEKADGEKIYVG